MQTQNDHLIPFQLIFLVWFSVLPVSEDLYGHVITDGHPTASFTVPYQSIHTPCLKTCATFIFTISSAIVDQLPK